MSNDSYLQKLQDPRWQKLRLSIFQRDDFTCRFCGNKDQSLHVHHLKYDKGKNPWDYEGKYLITLCSDCHNAEHEYRWDILNELRDAFGEMPLSYMTLECFTSAIDAYQQEVIDFLNDLFCKKLLYKNSNKDEILL